MIRWSYVVPRLLLLLLVGLLCAWGFNPLVKWALVSAGEWLIGSEVTIAEVRSSWVDARLTLDDVRLASPHSPQTDLLRCKQIELDLETVAALKKKLVASRARFHGLQFVAPRETPAAQSGWKLADRIPLEGLEQAAGRIPELGLAWIQDYRDSLDARVLGDQLETVRVADELRQEYEAKFDEYRNRIANLRSRGRTIRLSVEKAPADIIRRVQAYRRAAEEVKQIQSELEYLPYELDQLTSRARQDLKRLEQAKQRDLERIRAQIKKPQYTAEQLNEFLLGEKLAEQVRTALVWLDWIRFWFGAELEDLEPERARGIDVHFPRDDGLPALWVRSAEMDGAVVFNGQPVPFAGKITNLSTQPSQTGPTEMTLQVDSRVPVRLAVTLDRTGDLPRDRVCMQLEDIPVGQQQLGKPEQLALRMAPSQGDITIALKLNGEQLSGDVVWKQRNLRIEPLVHPAVGSELLAPALQKVASQITHFEMQAHLGGTLKDPSWQLGSPLGEQVAAALRDYFEQEVTATLAELETQLEIRRRQQTADLERLLARRPAQLLEDLRQGDRELKQFEQTVTEQFTRLNRFFRR